MNPKPFKALGILQNMWVRDPEYHRSVIASRGEVYRRRLLRYALFAGCLTGSRLRQVFGQDLCDLIVWENVSLVLTGMPSAKVIPDPHHIAERIREEQPNVVIAFGKVAEAWIRMIRAGMPESITVLVAPHPAARHAGCGDDLRRVADRVRGLYDLSRQEPSRHGQAL